MGRLQKRDASMQGSGISLKDAEDLSPCVCKRAGEIDV